MRRVLIFLEKDKIKPIGGPYGYNYNLLAGLKKNNCDYIFDTLDDHFSSYLKPINKKIASLRKKIFFFKPYDCRFLETYKNYDAIHFHTSAQMFRARNFLKTYKGKVLFTTHSPMLLSKEMWEDASMLSKLFFFFFFIRLRKVDKYAFRRADHIIFPCKESEDPYKKERMFRLAKREGKFLYMTSGVVDCKSKVLVSRTAYREKLHIPNGAFVFSYVGRHNSAKGYSCLKKAARTILDTRPDVFFLIGGKEAPIKGLKNNRWIEVGYTDDPCSLINASDVFVLPNRQTYFDLVFLEALSIGRRIIASSTGGNKYFKKYESDEIIFFERGMLADALKDAIAQDSENNSSENRDIYLREFTCEEFAQRYIKVLDSIFEGAK